MEDRITDIEKRLSALEVEAQGWKAAEDKSAKNVRPFAEVAAESLTEFKKIFAERANRDTDQESRSVHMDREPKNFRKEYKKSRDANEYERESAFNLWRWLIPNVISIIAIIISLIVIISRTAQ